MKKKKSLIVIGFILIVVLVAYCYRSTEYEKEMDRVILLKKNNEKVTFDGVEEPQVPNLTENNSTLSGIDTNKNKLRDDVEIWINRTAKDYNQRMAMRQTAINLEYRLLAAAENERDIMVHAENVSYTDTACLLFIFGIKEYRAIENRIDKMIYNTKERQDVLKNYNNFSYSYGSIVPNNSLDEPYRSCFFTIKNEQDLKAKFLESIKK